MAYYSYYQDSQPNWGTQQYQVVPPPIPRYQPQPSWSGADYYSAHSGIRDRTIFDYVVDKVRDLVGIYGVSRRKARRWWERIYTGLVSPAELQPRDIGAAAAYEALRCWETHRSIYAQPLSADPERGRDALIGIAVAEATRLWEYTGRLGDRYGRTKASEIAAATASRLFSESYEPGGFENNIYGSRSISRRRSLSTSGRFGTLDDSPYDVDEGGYVSPLDSANYSPYDEEGYLGINTTPRNALSGLRGRSLTPYRSRPVSPTIPFGDGIRRSPSPYGNALGRPPSPYGGGNILRCSPKPYAYGNSLADPGPYAYGMGSQQSPLPTGTLGSPIPSSITEQAASDGVVLGNSDVRYDPVLGPGIPGMYYPQLARAQVGGASYNMPGNMGGGQQYLNPPTLGQIGRRRSHSFSSYGGGSRIGY